MKIDTKKLWVEVDSDGVEVVGEMVYDDKKGIVKQEKSNKIMSLHAYLTSNGSF